MQKTRLLIGGIVLAGIAPLWAQKVPPGNDPGNNNPPPAGAILDLGGTPIPGGGTSKYQMYTTSFTATSNNTAITFAFREDPAFIFFSNPSVTDQTIASGNLLVNANFSGGTYTDNGNGSTPVGWIYANVYGATYGGVVSSACGAGPTGAYGVGFCWYDGAVQAYDALTQSIATVAGHSYKITFWIADDSDCMDYTGPAAGPIVPCNFSDLSTNGDTTDVGGNGIDVLVYTGAALPAPAAVHFELGRDAVAPNQGMQALASAQDTTGSSVDMKDAAQKVGFDHFNWLQIILTDIQLKACAANTSLPGCSSDFTITGTVPSLPTPDPPAGGYAYELCPAGPGCQTSFPAQDYWPMYWDEYFSPVPRTNFYTPNPNSPEYLTEYRQGNRLASMGATGVNPALALGFSFSDTPTTNFVAPGTTQNESINFVTALVGITGSCNVLISSNCGFQIFPGTTFKWTSTNGAVSFTSTPGGPLARTAPSGSIERRNAKQPDEFPTNPVDLTGTELANAIISVDEFLTLANLTPQSLAAMGGGISIFSGSLIPTQAAALAAVLSGLTLVPSSSVTMTASGLAYSRVTQTFNGTVTIKNIGSSAIAGPLQLVLNGLPVPVTMTNATGNFAGTPYLTVPTASFGPGQSVTVSVQFKNPSNTTINLAPSVYSGSVN